jgi:hypothetical protein
MKDFSAMRKGIPCWDGDPTKWAQYMEDMLIWFDGEDLDVSYNLTSRCIQNLSGSARRAALAIPKADLQPLRRARVVPQSSVDRDNDLVLPEVQVQVEQDLARGINNLLRYLEQSLQPDPAVRKGQTMKEFFATQQYHRQAGESVRSFLNRFGIGMSQMRDNGIDVEAMPDLAGWWLIQMMSLSEERQERLFSALPDQHFALPDVRLFGDLLTVEALSRQPSSQQLPVGQPSFWQGRRFRNRTQGLLQPSSIPAGDTGTTHHESGRTTFETGLTGDWADIVDEQSEVDAAEFQDMIRGELESFVTELDAKGGSMQVFPPERTAVIEQAVSSLACATDSLTTLREARAILQKTKSKDSLLPNSGPAVDLPPSAGHGTQTGIQSARSPGQ